MTKVDAEKLLKVYILDCPCCGSDDLEVGVMSSSSYGIMCLCGLNISVRIPTYYDESIMTIS